MQAMRTHGLQIAAVCGGCLSCGTCHVYVDDAWLPRLQAADAAEREVIEFGDHARLPWSRLSCQIVFGPELDGCQLELAPDTA